MVIHWCFFYIAFAGSILKWTTQPTSTTLGDTIQSFTVSLVSDVDFQTLQTSSSETIIVVLDSGTLTGTSRVSLSSGQATFTNLKPWTAGTHYLIAFSASYQPAFSSNFLVLLPGPYYMTISGTSSLTCGVAGGSWSVNLYDFFGNAYISPYSITMTLYGDKPDAVLGGTTTISTSNGIATFSSLSIDKTGNFYLYPIIDGTSIVPTAKQVTVSAPSTPSLMQISSLGQIGIGDVFSVTVGFYDTVGNLLSNAASITLTLNSGSLLGTATLTSSSGKAIFNTIYLNPSNVSPGSLTMTATCSAYSLSVSTSFTAIRTAALLFTMPSEPQVYSSTSSFTYSLQLNVKPTSNVQVSISSADTSKITVSASPLTFTQTNYNNPQSITLSIISSAFTSSSPMQTAININHVLSGNANYQSFGLFSGCDQVYGSSGSGYLTMTILKANSVGMIKLSGTFYAQEGNWANYYISLSQSPSSSVTITTQSQYLYAPNTLTFDSSNWSTSQTVWYKANQGTIGTLLFQQASINHQISTSDVKFMYAVAPSAEIIIMSASSSSYQIVQSSWPAIYESSTTTSVSYTIYLSQSPSAAVTISISVSSPLSVSPTSFNLYSSGIGNGQTVTLTYTRDNTQRDIAYYATLIHSVSSSDIRYDNIQNYSIGQSIDVLIMNYCSYGKYTISAYGGGCSDCPEGYECPDPVTKTVCNPGYHSPVGNFICLPCPPGFYCLGGTSKQPCSSGWYSLGFATACIQCTPGYSCPRSDSPPAECPLGTYAITNGATTCTPLSGSQIGWPDQTPSNCASGTFPSVMRTHCEKCLAGWICTDPTSRTMTICSFGYYSAPGSVSCTQCPAGHACSRSEDLGICPEGYYSTAGLGSCVECPIGSYCTGGSKYSCSNGWLHGQNVCTQCPVDYYCSEGIPPIPCPPGYIATLGAGVCTACALGEYRGTGQCLSCPAGYFCLTPVSPPYPCHFGTFSTGNAQKCTKCADQYTCDQGSSSSQQYPCPPGFKCTAIDVGGEFNQSATWPKPCDKGYYGTNCISCVQGFYCPGGTIDYQKFPCPPGHYCPSQSGTPTSCPASTYNPYWKQTSSSSCMNVSPGYFSNQGSPRQLVCPPGNYCVGGSSSTPQQCPSGKYFFGLGATSSSDCYACPTGYYCPAGSIQPTPCPMYYLIASTTGASSCSSCPAGSYCPIPRRVSTQLPCWPGYYCASANPPQKISAGHICEDTNLSADCTVQCPAGYYCPAGTADSRQPKLPCTAGYYCPQGSSTPIVCSDGTWSNKNYLTAQSECSTCPAGFYCTGGGTPITCSPGYYCPPGTPSSTSYPCPAGTYSSRNGLRFNGECIACPIGYYCPNTGMQQPSPSGAGYATTTIGSSSRSACSDGYYCPSNANKVMLPCGTGKYSSSGAASCSPCWWGYYCPWNNTSFSDMGSFVCPAGLWCPAGTDHYPTNLYDRCPAGKYCTLGTANLLSCWAGSLREVPGGSSSGDCVNVPEGFYVSTAGASSPTGMCAAGYYCPAGSTSSTANACSAGTFRMITGGTSQADCGECPAGFYCPSPTTTPNVCPSGMYCPAGSGWYTYCPAGTFSPGTQMTASTDCISCPAGYYCQSSGQSTVSGQCYAGYWCSGSNTSPYGQTALSGSYTYCPAGGYCPAGAAVPIHCSPGKYLDTTGNDSPADCKSCPSGKYCVGATSSYTGDCKAGFYCTGGASTDSQYAAQAGYYSGTGYGTQYQCSPGTYNPAQGQSTCLSCPSGFYCPNYAMTTPIICGKGYYCSGGGGSQSACPAGTYNLWTGMKSVSDCVDCPSGFACPNSATKATSEMVQCGAGYWCLKGASSSTPSDVSGKYGKCPRGYYCPTKSGSPTPCPPGTYGASYYLTGSGQCTVCDQGWYCMGLGLTTNSGQCQAGYYCPSGTKIPNPIATICTAGHYCPTGAYQETPCPAGQYQPNKGQSSCIQCPAGFYCPQGTLNYIGNECPAGYFCPAGTQGNHDYPCPTGTYNPITGGQSSSWCLACDAGKYCSGTGLTSYTGSCSAGYYCPIGSSSSAPYGCTPGYYCPTGSSKMKRCDGGSYCSINYRSSPNGKCSAGYYCISLATTNSPTDGGTGNICPVGFYCPVGSIAPVPCTSGTYNQYQGQTSSGACSTCPGGSYCQGSGLHTPSGSCAAGWYCPAGSKTPNAYGCAAGYRCPAGSSNQISCTSGTYQPQILQSSCLTCPQGYYCNGNSLTAVAICPSGYYCPSGTANYASYPCWPGTYNPAQGTVSSSACLTCPPGSYCSGSGNSAITGSCDAGCYCAAGSSSSCQHSCSSGYYCPQGSSTAITCPRGKYCGSNNLTAPSGNCADGYLCLLGSSTPTPWYTSYGSPCAAGTYCPSGTDHEIPCPIGTYSTSTQQNDLSDCLICPAGKYCNVLGATWYIGDCSAGFFCVAGSITDKPKNGICPTGSYCTSGLSASIPCPIGTYNNIKGQSSCFTCPSGFKCAGGTGLPVQCEPGYYCSGGNYEPGNKPQCSVGYYNPFSGQSACLKCPIGFDCAVGATAPTICPASYYCPEGVGKQKCPDGTYSEITGLQSSSNCKSCPTGKYCLNGFIVGNCNAGYFCQGGNSSPTPNDITTNSVYGIRCPTGYYCELGTTLPTPCPYGEFTTSPGATQVSDCKLCTAGYYCIPGDPIPYECPMGAYCPTASNEPSWCPAFTYSSATKATSISTCISCPAGYLCTDSGIGDYQRFPCPPGSYCPAGSLSSTPCPAGTWAAKSATPSAALCDQCPAGSYCLAGATSINPCQSWTWCPSGSSSEGTCPGGYLCHQNQTELVLCFAGFYCPETPDILISPPPPYACTAGSYCPTGSENQIACPVGNVYVPYSQRKTQFQACVPCGSGFYADLTDNSCKKCYAGYICLSGASKPNPQSLETDGGYPCPAGNYCPQGISSPISCPAGTYSEETSGRSVGDCLPCKENTYSDIEGQTGCFPCGPNARANTGEITCNCIGLNRSYMKRDGTCRCKPGYAFYSLGTDASEDDSDQDCVSLVRPLCQTDYIRDLTGNCVKQDDCSNECQGGEGKRNVDSGICFCRNIPSTYDVCDLSCQENITTVELNTDGTFSVKSITNTGNNKIYETETVDFQSSDGYSGIIYCQEGYSCNVKTIEIDSNSKAFTSNLEPTPFISNSAKRRRLENNLKLANPVICLELGETMIFSIPNIDDYPYYFKDSLLNTNPDFDYGPFLELAQVIKGGQNITNFGYTFREPGRYVFAVNSDPSNILIISAMNLNQLCSSPQIRERSATTITKVGVYQSHNINKETDWKNFLFIMMVFLTLIIFLSTVQIFHRRSHKKAVEKNLEIYKDMLQTQGGGNETLILEQAMPKQMLNPKLFQAIYEKLLELSDLMRSRMKTQKEKESKHLASLMESLKDLKSIISDATNQNSSSPVKNSKSAHKEILSLKETFIVKNLQEKIERDAKLKSSQKQALLEEFNENIANLEAQLAEDRVSAQNTLKSRIEERSKRRREFLQKKNLLIGEEKLAKDRMQREVKDAENFAQQSEKEYEKEKRRARERVFGNAAKSMRKQMLENIRKSPDIEEELKSQYEQQMEFMEQSLKDEKGIQHRSLMKRIEEKRSARIAQAQGRIDVANEEYRQVVQSLEGVINYTEFLNAFEESLPSSLNQPIKQIEVSDVEERSLDRKYEEIQQQSDIAYDAVKSQLETQKYQLSKALSNPANSSQKSQILESLRKIEEKIENTNREREQEQRKILLERLQERQQIKKDKKQKALDAYSEANQNDQDDGENLRRLEEFVRNLPINEQVEAAKELLADKHDKEIIELQYHQLARASGVHLEKLRTALENKTASIKAAEKHLAEATESQKQVCLASLILETEKEAQKEFEANWRDHQRKCNDELLQLLGKQMNEVRQMIRKTEVNPEMERLNEEFRQRQEQVEKEVKERMDVLEYQKSSLEKTAREKQEELENQMAQARQQAEVERIKRELIDKQRKEQEEAKIKGNLTKQQMEQLIAQHQSELKQLESTLAEEKERQRASLKKKLEEKREKKRKLLQVPKDMRHLDIATAQLLKEFREGEHCLPEFDEDLLSELLRRISKVEQIISNVDNSQFAGAMKGLQHISEQLKKF